MHRPGWRAFTPCFPEPTPLALHSRPLHVRLLLLPRLQSEGLVLPVLWPTFSPSTSPISVHRSQREPLHSSPLLSKSTSHPLPEPAGPCPPEPHQPHLGPLPSLTPFRYPGNPSSFTPPQGLCTGSSVCLELSFPCCSQDWPFLSFRSQCPPLRGFF